MASPLRRYTELPFVIDLLQSKKLVLLNPKSWDDRNDSFYIEQYASRKRYASTYVLCLTQAPETYHHWRVFSHGSGGACVQFDKEMLVAAVMQNKGLRAEDVQYKRIRELREKQPRIEDLPFLKRHAYRDDKEFRLFQVSKEKGKPTLKIPIPLTTIQSISLSPWLHIEVAAYVAKTLKSIEGCAQLKIVRSTLVENEEWKTFAVKEV